MIRPAPIDSSVRSPLSRVFLLALLTAVPRNSPAEAPPAATAAFNTYAASVESRLALQHRSPATFIAPATTGGPLVERLRRGDQIIENLTPKGSDPSGAMLHHWRGTAFVPGATAADFERLMKDFNDYPRDFAPQVLRARVLQQQGDRLVATMRVRQKHVLTVVMDTTYDIAFGRLDARHGYSSSRSTQISEIDAPGSAKEHVLDAREEHGFLWRQNTYWSFAEQDGGLVIQVESISLSRSIPTGLGWAVRPFVESVPRESLEFTLRATSDTLQHRQIISLTRIP